MQVVNLDNEILVAPQGCHRAVSVNLVGQVSQPLLCIRVVHIDGDEYGAVVAVAVVVGAQQVVGRCHIAGQDDAALVVGVVGVAGQDAVVFGQAGASQFPVSAVFGLDIGMPALGVGGHCPSGAGVGPVGFGVIVHGEGDDGAVGVAVAEPVLMNAPSVAPVRTPARQVDFHGAAAGVIVDRIAQLGVGYIAGVSDGFPAAPELAAPGFRGGDLPDRAGRIRSGRK